jgi:sodium pump decarboxylase gamma subunit
MMSELSMMEKFADPTLFDTLSMSDKATGALITTCMGMGTTFLVLVLLWGIIVLMNKFLTISSAAKVVSAAPAVAIATNTTPTVNVEESVETEAQLIAVITAAIAAYETTNQVTSNLIVRKINRVRGQATAWGNAGTTDCIETRKF